MNKALCILDREACHWTYGNLVDALARECDLLAPPFASDELAKHARHLAEAEVIFTGWGAPLMDEEFLSRAPALRAVFYAAGSVRPFASDAFWERNFTLCTAGGLNAIPTAEFAAAVITLSLKHTWRDLLYTRRNRSFPAPQVAPGAYGSTVGLLSLGAVGRLVRDRLRTSAVKVVAWDPFVPPERGRALDVELVSLEEVFARSDVISVHTPLLPETRGLIGRELLGSMKTGATFVNTARGGLVVEEELIAVMAARPDLTAFLDVTEPEPPKADSPLYTLPNVMLTPHLAGSRFQECRRMGEAMLGEYRRWIRGEPLLHAIDRRQALIMA